MQSGEDSSGPAKGPSTGQPTSRTGEERDLWAERPGQARAAADEQPGRGRRSGKPAAGDKDDGVGKEPGWERSVLEKLAFASLKEQRARRRWNILLRFLFLAYLVFLAWLFLSRTQWTSEPARGLHTAMVNIQGVIAEDKPASARYLLPALRAAFEQSQSQAVLLNINSPGGSPVQAGIVHDEILRLKAKHGKPVYAVIGDAGASAAYYIAVAADRIYVDKASLVGSIGVLLNGFGFTEAMDRLGVERRLLTSGEHKGFLDPFSPMQASDVEHAKQMLRQIHQQFITVVREGRGERLKESPEMFSGLFWTGEESIQLGLADAYGSVHSVARDVVQAEKLIDYSYKRNLADQLANRLGASLGAGVGTGAMQELQGEAVPWR
ncbi:S49 family peptidase [Corticibacter populi]|uniref:S49 family peptidase n=1 Tax=Corticibacter populi TaxID=1550736 RepID=A0A3M6QU30_9BURK|nr:S49 family peptidase [Corticibacter populi]RMX06516.1 S49 family peptidase [Corticibacter populi]RZS31923.1 protease-4 [Corticibacter populi]